MFGLVFEVLKFFRERELEVVMFLGRWGFVVVVVIEKGFVS